jgi:hypothetical protein
MTLSPSLSRRFASALSAKIGSSPGRSALDGISRVNGVVERGSKDSVSSIVEKSGRRAGAPS